MERVLVAIYCRLSEEDRNKLKKSDDSESIQNQKSLLVEYAMKRGWELYNIYSDEDYAGADRSRPQWKKLLEDAEKHLFQVILCKSQSRFTREIEMVEKYINGLFPIWGIRFVSVVDNADTNDKNNKKSRQINGLMNEWYLEDLSNNIKAVFDSKRRQGYHIGAFALYGYKKDPDQKGHLIIDEEAAEIVREIFTLYSQGYGKMAIVRKLNERGVPNPTEYKRLHGLRYKAPKGKVSTMWKYFNISDMLINEIYIGNMVQGKYGSVSYKTKQSKPRPKEEWFIVENTHEPIIDRELWNSVQKLLKQKSKPFIMGEIGIFSRKTKCMYCEATMGSHKNHGRHYLQCVSKHIAPNACIGSFISVIELENAVIRELKMLSTEFLDKEYLVQNVKLNDAVTLTGKREQLVRRREAYQQKMNEYEKGLKELYLDKVKGVITEKEYLNFSVEFREEKDRLQLLVSELQNQITEIEETILEKDDRREIIKQYIQLEKLDRPTVEKLIDYILIGRRNHETGEVPIEIHWNF